MHIANEAESQLKLNWQSVFDAMKKVLTDRRIVLDREPKFDGNIERYPVDGRKRGNRDAWFVGHIDDYPVLYGGIHGGEDFKYSPLNGSRQCSPEEKRRMDERIAEAKRKRAEELKAQHSQAAKEARAEFEAAIPATDDHPYLIKKQVKAHGIRLDSDGRLLIPVTSESGEIRSLQRIYANGEKRFLSGGEVKGNYFTINGNGPPIICEGYSTGATLFECTGRSVFVAFNAGNLEPVALKIRKQYPSAEILIAADNDQWKPEIGNVGVKKAKVAASVINARVAIPEFKDVSSEPTDFNDLLTLEGADEVIRQLSPQSEQEEDTEDFDQTVTRAELSALIEQCADFDELITGIAEKVSTSGLPATQILSLRKYIVKRSKELNPNGGVSVSSLEADAKEFKHIKAEKDFQHLQAARAVIAMVGAENLIHDGVFTWKYNGHGLWVQADDREIKKSVHKISESEELTKTIVGSILDLFKTEIYKSGHVFDVDRRTINCPNGELHYVDHDWVLKPHCRENYRTTQIATAYDPAAKAPRFLRYLQEVFRDDSDRVNKTALVLECIGYSLLSSCEYEKFFILSGSGANGKSKLMNAVQSLVGVKNICAVQPSQFDNKFQRAHLHHRLVNLVTEIAQGAEIPDAQLKAIVSGELTTAEHKHKNPFDFRPYVTCWFGTNHMPHTRDFSDALFRRAIIIPFNRIFQEEEQDKQLDKKLADEAPGILSLALEGLTTLFERGSFIETQECLAAKKAWRYECDQAAQFVDECCLLGPGLSVLSADLYVAYQKWATDSGVRRTLGRNSFSSRVIRLGAEAGKGTAGARMLYGVGLK
ncbi:MAG: phage/plasmid primase, P4 family [Desulfobacterales bacterium]|jgi:P4 family phage/plasmid primase-like protien|nr:phage/plasmid primase, P4 family [Desulfobacterales bacterium]